MTVAFHQPMIGLAPSMSDAVDIGTVPPWSSGGV